MMWLGFLLGVAGIFILAVFYLWWLVKDFDKSPFW